MSASCDPSNRPGEADPYAYFAARGVSRDVLHAWLDDEVRRTVKSYRIEGEPIAELYQLLGLDWMVALMAALGGAEIYVPESVDLAIAKWPELPVELCRRLADRRGGSRVAVPTAHCALATCRRDLVIRRAVAGLTDSDIAREVGITARHVRSIVRAAKHAGVVIQRDHGGDRSVHELVVRRRHEQIMRLSKSGMPFAEIARKLGISKAKVAEIAKRTNAEAIAPC